MRESLLERDLFDLNTVDEGFSDSAVTLAMTVRDLSDLSFGLIQTSFQTLFSDLPGWFRETCQSRIYSFAA